VAETSGRWFIIGLMLSYEELHRTHERIHREMHEQLRETREGLERHMQAHHSIVHQSQPERPTVFPWQRPPFNGFLLTLEYD